MRLISPLHPTRQSRVFVTRFGRSRRNLILLIAIAVFLGSLTLLKFSQPASADTTTAEVFPVLEHRSRRTLILWFHQARAPWPRPLRRVGDFQSPVRMQTLRIPREPVQAMPVIPIVLVQRLRLRIGLLGNCAAEPSSRSLAVPSSTMRVERLIHSTLPTPASNGDSALLAARSTSAWIFSTVPTRPA